MRATVLVALACALVWATHMAGARAASQVLPDLVADKPGVVDANGNPWLEVYNDAGGTRLLLRFDGYVHNVGPGPTDVRASSPTNGLMATKLQRIGLDNGSTTNVALPAGAIVRYEESDGHHHFHLMEAARYSLMTLDHSTLVAPASKIGFCLIDAEQIEPGSAGAYTAGCGGAASTSVVMGLSPGWRDKYWHGLGLQWVDISDVQPGEYVLRSEVDTKNLIREKNESNAPNFAARHSIVPGYLARAIARGAVSSLGPTSIDLAASKFGSPGTRQLRIVDPPDHGTLDWTTGGWFSGPTVKYTPNAGYQGPDSFTFAARDASSGFPRHPATAAVTLDVGGTGQQALAISGVPESLYTGRSVQLQAVGGGASVPATWAVNGTDGGAVSIGRITQSGLYTAPASVPAGGSVRVGATAASGATGDALLRIEQAPAVRPAPGLDLPSGAATSVLSKPVLHRHGRRLAVKVLARRAGRLSMAVRDRRHRIRRCRVRLARRQAAVCRFLLPRRYAGRRARRLRVTVALRSGGKLIAVRRARVR